MADISPVIPIRILNGTTLKKSNQKAEIVQMDLEKKIQLVDVCRTPSLDSRTQIG